MLTKGLLFDSFKNGLNLGHRDGSGPGFCVTEEQGKELGVHAGCQCEDKTHMLERAELGHLGEMKPGLD